MIYKIFDTNQEIQPAYKSEIVNFLFNHLEQYGDSMEDIGKAIDFALQWNDPSSNITPLGGFVLVATENNEIVGTVVINKTGMNGYIPDNILVYIAIHKGHRGKGHGKELLLQAIERANGDIKLHVEPDNPARFLYQKLGFTEPYIEMRFKNNKS